VTRRRRPDRPTSSADDLAAHPTLPGTEPRPMKWTCPWCGRRWSAHLPDPRPRKSWLQVDCPHCHLTARVHFGERDRLPVVGEHAHVDEVRIGKAGVG